MGRRKHIERRHGRRRRNKPRGWLQQQILLLLCQREMYGLEIIKRLEIQGRFVSPGQLYPTLKRMEEESFVKRTKIVSRGVEKHVFSILKPGRVELENMIANFLSYIEFLMWEDLIAIREEIFFNPLFKNSTFVADFSVGVSEIVGMEVARQISPDGRYFFTVPNEFEFDSMIQHIQLDKLTDIVFPLLGNRYNYPIADNKVDIAFSFFSLHEDVNPEVVLKEMIRVIKPNGHIIITDLLKVDNAILNVISRLLPDHEQVGTDLERVKNWLIERGFQCTAGIREGGAFLLLAHRDNS